MLGRAIELPKSGFALEIGNLIRPNSARRKVLSRGIRAETPLRLYEFESTTLLRSPTWSSRPKVGTDQRDRRIVVQGLFCWTSLVQYFPLRPWCPGRHSLQAHTVGRAIKSNATSIGDFCFLSVLQAATISASCCPVSAA